MCSSAPRIGMRSPLAPVSSRADRTPRGRAVYGMVARPRRLRGAALPRPDEQARVPKERAPRLEDREPGLPQVGGERRLVPVVGADPAPDGLEDGVREHPEQGPERG